MIHDNSGGGSVEATMRADESAGDFRARRARLQAEALLHWQKQLAEQSSILNSPSDRIRTWERRHQIDLPRDPAHRLIKLIAASTGLGEEDVYEEQRARAEARAGIVATVP